MKDIAVKTNFIELQLIDEDTNEPLSNINVRYKYIIKRGKYRLLDWYAYDVEEILIKEKELFTNENGIVFIEEEEINKQQMDSVFLRIYVNITFDNEKVEDRIKEYGLTQRNEHVDITPGYFILYNYRDYVSFIDENYYPAYIYLLFNKDVKNYLYMNIINQINNNGNSRTDFNSVDIEEENINKLIPSKIIIRLTPTCIVD